MIWRMIVTISLVLSAWLCTVDGRYQAGPFPTYRDCAHYQSTMLFQGHSAICGQV
jgi:hypothetical protein